MEKQAGYRLVHYYDTERRQILCGLRRAEDHSSKHARSVTCSECIALLRARADASAAAASTGAGV